MKTQGLERDGYVPPPSRFAGEGFAAFGDTAVLDRSGAEAPEGPAEWLFAEEAVDQEDAPVAQQFTEEPPAPRAPGPRPARAVGWQDFDHMLLGSGHELNPEFLDEAEEQRHSVQDKDRLASAALIASVLGFVTAGLGFVAGSVMGQLALRRLGRAGWFESADASRRTARTAVMIGSIGLGLVATGLAIAGTWWLANVPLETILPGLAPGAG